MDEFLQFLRALSGGDPASVVRPGEMNHMNPDPASVVRPGEARRTIHAPADLVAILRGLADPASVARAGEQLVSPVTRRVGSAVDSARQDPGLQELLNRLRLFQSIGQR